MTTGVFYVIIYGKEFTVTFTDILIIAGNILIMVVGVFYSIILHEIGHGYAAHMYGDDTALDAGRISLNPIRHVDPLGTIILPLALKLMGMPMFGWAKPVPVNPGNFNRKGGMTAVSLAGVFMNLIIAILMFTVFSIFMKFEPYASLSPAVLNARLVEVTVFPNPAIFVQIAGINIMLLIFNMLPFPPLDGFNFLVSVLPERSARWLIKNQRIFSIIFLVLLFTGLLKYIYVPILNVIINLFRLIFRF